MIAIWIYGRSGAGKTTLATNLKSSLGLQNIVILDGDKMREGLCSDLSFSKESRDENHRRIAEIAKILIEQKFLPIVTTIAPQNSQRDIIHKTLNRKVMMVYVNAPLEVCIKRDPKGLYKKGSSNGILTYPFDEPRSFDVNLTIDTTQSIQNSCKELHAKVLQFVTGSLHLK